jgi:pyridoxal phosphate enzyme (YggS family)
LDGFGERLARVEGLIAGACARVGRQRREVTLVAASKSQPVESLRHAVSCGIRLFGENRVQEGRDKAAQLPGLTWHLLGPLQSNKVRMALEVFSTLHALDRPSIVTAVDREAGRQKRRVAAFVEVNLALEPSKHGFAPADLLSQRELFESVEHLDLLGLMAIPPPGAEAEASRPWFHQLAALRDQIGSSQRWPGFVGALSMGMSDDFEVAIEEGATHVRVGTSLFGARPAPAKA